jgi:hypothetical protein
LRNDSDRHGSPDALVSRPFILKHTITAAIEIGILREVIERLGWPIESRSDLMATVIRRLPFDTARLRLRRAGPHLLAGQYKCTGNVARSPFVIDLIFVTVANFAMHLRRAIGKAGPFFKPCL